MLLKGVAEVPASGRPVAAAEMVLVRIAHAADLPTPDEVVRSLSENGVDRPVRRGTGRVQASSQSYAPRYEAPRGSPRRPPRYRRGRQKDPTSRRDEAVAARTLSVNSFAELIALAAEKRDITIEDGAGDAMRAGPLRGRPARRSRRGARAEDAVHDLQRKLTGWTGKRLDRGRIQRAGRPTMRAQADAQQAEIERGVQNDPLVQAVLSRFPGAKIVGVTQNGRIRRSRSRMSGR